MPLREHYRARYLDTLLHLTQHYRAHSEYARAIETAQRLLAHDPANERAHQHLMFCHLANGNRAAALAQFDACQRALRDELGVEPSSETTALDQWLKQEPSEKSAAARRTNLPIPLSSLVGRQNETRELKEILGRARLLTLTGVGGSGKTRLAIHVATDLIDQFPDGVWWVTLEALSDGARVPQTIATTLGVRESPTQALEDALAQHIGQRQLLLVLDNCEHLVEASARILAALLRQGHNLRVITTSREAFRLEGETMWCVPPLGLPPAAPRAPNVVGELAQMAMQYEAVRLFVERASATRRDFQMTDVNAGAVIEICRRLDGIPLALELAAARVNLLTVEEIASRLNDRFRLLTDGNRATLPRQQTLRALIDWSFDLLAPNERALFCRLSVFAGGWTLASAEAVCCTQEAGGSAGTAPTADRFLPTGVLDLRARLVAKSLVLSEVRGDFTRYRMLDTIREYAHERLQESSRADDAHACHAQFFLNDAETIDAQLKDKAQAHLLDHLEIEQDNFLAALEWSLAQQPEAAMRLANALGDFWTIRGYWADRRAWFERVLDHPRLSAPTRERAIALNFAGALALRLRDWRAARADFEQSLEMARALGDRETIASAQSNLGVAASEQHSWAEGRARYEETLALRRELGKPRLIAMTLNNLGVVAKNQGDYASARAYYEEGLALHRQADNKQGMMASHGNLGTLALNEHAYDAARTHIAASLALARELGDQRAVAMGTGNLARVLFAQENWSDARGMLEQACALFRALNDRLNLAAACYDLGYAMLRQNDLATAAQFYREGIAASRALGASASILSGLQRFANLALAQNDPARAARLLASIRRASREINVPVSAFEHKFFENDLEHARAQLDDAAFTAAWRAGEAMSLEQAVEYAAGSKQ